MFKVCRTISGGNREQVARVLDLLPSSSSSDVCKPVSPWDFQVCIPYHLENKISIRHPLLYIYVVRIMILNQGGDVRPGTCFSSQSKGQQKCHGVRKTEIKACLFDVNVFFSHTFL